MSTVSIIGATTWGNTIGRLLANKNIMVNIWTRTEARARELSKSLQQYPASTSSNINFTNHSNNALRGAEYVIWAVPAQSLRQTIRQVADQITVSMLHVSLAKGLEAENSKRMSEVIAEEISATTPEQICVLSGPNLSQEINRGLPATSVLAARNIEIAEKTRKLFHSPNFAVFTSDDIVGVELCGALKNVIALGAGMVDGMGLGDNAKATLITFGWAEATSLGSALGARSSTFYSLAGLGDLIATCAGPQSRNHFVGREVASGRPLGEVRAAMSNIAEGIDTTAAAYRLAVNLRLNTPIINLIYKVLFESLPPVEITNRFKQGLKPEAIV
jgi:glycerol-3-phosphate dehydrogenase (NAD(P)+)